MTAILDELTGGHVPPVTADLVAAEPFVGQDSDGNVAIVAYDIDYSVVLDWAAVLVDAGYVDNTDLYAIDYVIMDGEIVLDADFEDGSAIQIDVYFMDAEGNYTSEGTGDMAAYLFYTEPALTEFPAADIAAYLDYYYGITGVDVPSFDAEEYVIYPPSADYPFIEVDGVSDTDLGADYATDLAAAGWTEEDIDGYVAYIDPTGAVVLEMGYNVTYSTFYIIVYPAPTTEWPAALIDEVLTALGATNVELPILEGADYYEVNTDYLEWLGAAYVLCYGIDGAATYNAALEAAGWTYDTENEIYLDPTETIAVYAEYHEGEGTQITIQLAPAKPVSEFPAAELAAILADNGYSGVLIPAPEGEFTGYMIDDMFADYGMLYINCYSSTDSTAAYEAQLEAAGWTYDAEEMWYVSPDNVDITVSPYYYTDSGYLEIAIYWPAEF